MIRRLLILATLTFVACSTTLKKAPRRAAASVDPLIADVYVEHVGPAKWRVRYKLSQTVTSLKFERHTNRFRHKTWKPITPGVSIIEQAERELVAMIKPRAEFEVELETMTDILPKDYEFFREFSDKSIVMYSGHLNLLEATRASGASVEPVVNHFHFKPLSTERIIQNGQVSDLGQSVDASENMREGTYVYFGSLEPIQTQALTALVDPGLPKWLREKTFTNLPKLFDFYRERLGVSLPFKPFVLVSVQELTSSGLSSGGGTLPGMVELSVSGEGWRVPSAPAEQNYFRFLAHESAHLWNGQVFNDPEDVMWMHEGGADAFAYRTMLMTSVINEKTFRSYLSKAYNECLAQLGGAPISRNPGPDREFRPAYTCGSTLALITEGLVKKGYPARNLFDFWRELFARAQGTHNEYTEKNYAQLLHEWSGVAADDFLSLIHKTSRQGHAAFAPWFERAGIEIVETNDADRETHQRWARELLRGLMSRDCQGALSITAENDAYALDALPECDQIRAPFKARSVEGIDLMADGVNAYDRAQAKCARDPAARIELTDTHAKKTLKLACPKLTPRPPLFEVHALAWGAQ